MIVQYIFHETNKTITDLFPDRFGEPINEMQKAEAAVHYADEQRGWWPVESSQTGYLQ